MKREIKFRVWDKKINSLIRWENNDNREFFLHFGSGSERMIRCYDGYSEKTVVWGTEMLERYVIQQFTGLLDKNNKEIYEGDFVRIHNSAWGKAEVKFNHGCYEGAFGVPIGRLYKHELEVVGNIFENPELST